MAIIETTHKIMKLDSSDDGTYYIQVDVTIDGYPAYSKCSEIMDEHNARIHAPLFSRDVRQDEIEYAAQMQKEIEEGYDD